MVPKSLILCFSLIVTVTACTGGDAVSNDRPKEPESAENPPADAGDTGHRFTNRLAQEKSPYLLQHAHNPVDWYPWGEEAFAKARAEDKPIFLSVGYSTCHWCHVMERETFENEEIAALMNEMFVNVKVDREERPDVDNVYMDAVQSMTGQGGWPMSVWMTPDLKPFYAGTYFPPGDRQGMSGFVTVIRQLHSAWTNRRDQVLSASNQLQSMLVEQAGALVSQSEAAVDSTLLTQAYHEVARSFDPDRGGFGGAPKFPTPHKVRYLLRYHHRTGEEHALTMARKTLDEMAMGGIRDHLGGGFHRYSTDSRWLVPHFEKMLYDQAGLALAYTDAWLVTGEPVYEAIARDICDYVLEYMTHPELGAFYSAEDADSEGEEGKFYVWKAAEVREILGDDLGNRFLETYQSSDMGNWESVNIPHVRSLSPITDPKMIDARRTLLEVRDQRIRPHLDDKIVTAWNGFMIEALAYAGKAFQEDRYVRQAEAAAKFVDQHLMEEERVLRHYRNGPANIKGYLDDYAFMARGHLALYEATGTPWYLKRARDLCRHMVDLFGRPEGGFLFMGSDQEALITPVIELYDGAMPSGNAAATFILLRVGHLTADENLKDAGWKALKTFSGVVTRSPSAYLEMISAADFAVGPASEILLAVHSEEELAPFLDTLRSRYLPNAVLAVRTLANQDDIVPLVPYLKDQGPLDRKPTAYVCTNYACRLPVHDAAGLADQLP